MTTTTRRNWTDAMDALLRSLHAEGMNDPAIAKRMGITESVARHRRRNLKLPAHTPQVRPHWTAAKDARVRAEYPRCADKEALAASLGVTSGALRMRAHHLGVRDELFAEKVAERERGRHALWLEERDALREPEADERRLARARQLAEAVRAGASTPRQLKQAGWALEYVESIVRESPERFYWGKLGVEMVPSESEVA